MVVRVHGVHVAAVRFCVPRHKLSIMSLATLNQDILNYFNQILQSGYTTRYLEYLSQLSNREIMVMAVVAASLILIMVYRKLGTGAVFGLCLIYFIIYIILCSNIFDNWRKEKMEENRRMQIYNAELQKK